MSGAQPVSGHHGADLGAEFLPGVGLGGEAVVEALLEGVSVEAVGMAAGVAQFVQRRLVVVIGGRKLALFGKDNPIAAKRVVGAVSPDVPDGNAGGLDDCIRPLVGLPCLARLRLRLRLEFARLLDIEDGVDAGERVGQFLVPVHLLPVLVLDGLAFLVR